MSNQLVGFVIRQLFTDALTYSMGSARTDAIVYRVKRVVVVR